MNHDVNKKVPVITGAGSGMSLALAKDFAEVGALQGVGADGRMSPSGVLFESAQVNDCHYGYRGAIL